MMFLPRNLSGSRVAKTDLHAGGFRDEMYPHAQTVSLDGFEICYREAGEGETILLLHGIPLCMTTWQAVFAPLSQSHRVVAVDMPGYGRSSKTGEDYSLDAIAGRIIALCAALRIARVHVAGSSFGAAVAITMALRAPDLVGRLIIVNSVGIAGGAHSIEKLVRSGLIRWAVAGLLRRHGTGKAIFRSKLRKSYAATVPDAALVDHCYGLLLRDHGERAFLKTLRQFSEGALQKRLPELRHTVLSVWGSRDGVLPVKNSVNIQMRLADCWSVILPDAGHLPHEERPEAFVALVRRFLAMP
ncbi:alpha/beta fold hydrolase [Breoghania sp. L-A4]|uniref:alpha/beta fold hydrolase n=1 Tax=Breoghania sp. L-A4 TaxID=2304600 RepID=UPI000E359191|nr:alpha/beta fold hydrolase [Breoghania sp. L-A4]AXS41680.1 alpha/beta fold hydrolase [Breoghania sp. L-A4]